MNGLVRKTTPLLFAFGLIACLPSFARRQALVETWHVPGRHPTVRGDENALG